MALENRSRQREALLADLASRTDHPTADELYFSLREEFPNISLGTVYRNLAQLSENNTILKLTCGGADHFDYNTQPHYHLLCSECNRLYDLNMPVLDELDNEAQKYYNGKINDHRLIFYGICENCFIHNKHFNGGNVK